MIDQDAIARLRALVAEVNVTSEGDYLARLANGERIALACADFIRDEGKALLALAEAVENLPAPLTNSQAWPTGYVDGYNDALIVVEQSLRILAAMPTPSSGGEKADG